MALGIALVLIETQPVSERSQEEHPYLTIWREAQTSPSE